MKPTRFKTTDGQRLFYDSCGHCWRIFHYDPKMPKGLKFAVVGPIYTTQTELLGDLDRYAREFGF